MTGESAESVAIVKHSVTHHAIKLHGFRLSGWTGTPTPLDCAETRWVPLAHAIDLPLSAPQKILIERVAGRCAR